jgi:hypothetical protein
MQPKLAAVVVAVFVASAARAGGPNEILARAKTAVGGPACDAVRSIQLKGKISVGGLTGAAESFHDVLTGRFVEHYQLGPASGAEGFDGNITWSQDASGQARIEEGGDARLGAIDEAYRVALAYWYPQRWPAQIENTGEREENGRRFFTLRITPKGGRPFDLWIDAATNLMDRTVEKAAIETRTTFMSDYRTVGGVKMPFASRSTNGDPHYDQSAIIETAVLNMPVEDAAFKLPAPPPPDFSIAGGKTWTTVPFELLNNHIYVNVKLNGKGPYRLLCDTGGANVITPELAKELGVTSQGAFEGRGVGEKSEDIAITKVEKVEVGDAKIANQVFAVYPLGPFSAVEGVPQFGLIGYEVFKRFVAKVDYEKGLLTLWLPAAFTYQGTGTVVPFVFNEHIPQVEGSIDGFPGKFDIDTGARNSVTILAPFAEKNHLRDHLGTVVPTVTGWGMGGAARGLLARAKVLKLGGVEVGAPVVDLSQQKKGAFTDPYVAGNVGAGVLKRFNVTFDYGHQTIIFEPNANFARPDTCDRAGMWLNRAADGFEVMDVVEGGPAAAAGVKVGDRIVAIDGTPAEKLPLPEVRERFRTEPVGTAVKLAVLAGGQQREVKLLLRDLVPGS